MMYQFQDLERLFNPASIAVVGASDRPNSIGALALENIVKHSAFGGELYLVNPKKKKIGDHICYLSVAALPVVVDVAVIVIPAEGVIEALEQAGAKRIPFAIILTSGFSEAGEEGKAAEQKIKEIVSRTGIRVYGPNCPGLVNINRQLGMTFSPAFRNDLRKGPIGVATQGGGLGRNIIQSMDRGAGFAVWSSSGNEADLQVADFIYYMAGNDDIKVIITLVEGIKDGPRFVAAIQHAARMGKPVVGLKVGHSEYGAIAARSHTASITGSAEVNSTVLKQFGVIEVNDLDELVDVATLLVRKIPDGTEKVAVFASSGGATSLCADNIGVAGLTLSEFSPDTIDTLSRILPEYAAIHNPVDTTSVTVSAPHKFRDSLIPVAEDPDTGLVLIPLAMDYGQFSDNTARLIIEAQSQTGTPICPIWMSDRIGGGYKILSEAGITPFRSLRNMGVAVKRWLEYGKWRKDSDPDWQPLLLKTGALSPAAETGILNEIEGKKELAEAGIPVTYPGLARSESEAAVLATGFAGPVAMKIVSPDITHKSDIGGVLLDITGGEAAASAFTRIENSVRSFCPDAEITGVLVEPMAPKKGLEFFVGVSRDPVFGHIMTFGLGGIYVEIFRDITRRMLPVNKNMAESMLSELKSLPLLAGVRGQEAGDTEALVEFIIRVSDYVVANTDRIETLDINPVWVGKKGQGVLALDTVIEVRK